jgi:putative flippase GtrA
MVVGVIGALVDFGVFNLFTEVAGLPPEVSGTISLVLAICSNFLWNRYWTYPDSRSKPIGQQFVQFFIVNVLGVVIRLPIIALLRQPLAGLAERLFSLDPATAETIGNNLALAVAVVVVMFWNFFVNRFWTYSDVGDWGDTNPTGETKTPSAGSTAAQESG